MTICEATKKAVAENKYIARRDSPFFGLVKIKPTDTPDVCMVYEKGKDPCRGWEPKARDLTSDCWEVVD